MTKRLLLFSTLFLTLSVLLLASSNAAASPTLQETATPLPTPTFDIARLDRPETSNPP